MAAGDPPADSELRAGAIAGESPAATQASGRTA